MPMLSVVMHLRVVMHLPLRASATASPVAFPVAPRSADRPEPSPAVVCNTSEQTRCRIFDFAAADDARVFVILVPACGGMTLHPSLQILCRATVTGLPIGLEIARAKTRANESVPVVGVTARCHSWGSGNDSRSGGHTQEDEASRDS